MDSHYQTIRELIQRVRVRWRTLSLFHATVRGALAAAAVLAAVMFGGRGPARQAYDAAALVLFPEHVRLNVVPGNARVKAGSGLAIEASLAGNRAPVTPQVQMQSGGDATWHQAAM